MRAFGRGGARGRLLIVEDDRHSYDELRSELMERGYECEVALDMATARSVLAERRMDMAVVNVQIPETSEEGVLAELAEYNPQMQVVFYNGSTEKAHQRRLRRCGAASYLSTASDLGAVVRAVERVYTS